MVLSGEEDLKRMKDKRMEKRIGILKCIKFWRNAVDESNLRTNFVKRDVKHKVRWGYLYNTDCQICKRKNHCNENLNIEMFVNYM